MAGAGYKPANGAMKLGFTVLGSGTALGHALRGAPGFLLHVHGKTFLVDGGSGTLQKLARAGLELNDLDGGFYSHKHLDHCADLLPLLFAMNQPPKRPLPYPIWAGRGFGQYLELLRPAYDKWMDRAALTELSTTGPDEVQIGPLTVKSAPANHTPEALHFRFEAFGHSVVFSGDTEQSTNLTHLAAKADLLVCECGGSDDQPLAGHLTPRAIAELASLACPREIWLTHLYPQVDPLHALEVVSRAKIPVHLANDGDCWSRR